MPWPFGSSCQVGLANGVRQTWPLPRFSLQSRSLSGAHEQTGERVVLSGDEVAIRSVLVRNPCCRIGTSLSSRLPSCDGVMQEIDQESLLLASRQPAEPYQRDTTSQHECGDGDAG